MVNQTHKKLIQLTNEEICLFAGGSVWYDLGQMIGSFFAPYNGCDCSNADYIDGYDSWYP